MPRPVRPRLLLAAALMAALPSVSAATSSAAPPASAQVCGACHGARGEGGGIYPRIAGQPAQYLQEQLRLFRSGARPNAMMQPLAKGLTDADIVRLAGYFSAQRLRFTPAKNKLSAAEMERGRQLVTVGDWQHGVPACVRCHGPDLGGVAPLIPALAGQSRQYLITALQSARGLEAPADNFPRRLMRRVSSGLSDVDISAVTGYIATLKAGEMLRVSRPAHDALYKAVAQLPNNFTPPPDAATPDGPDGEAIWRGRQVFEDTQRYAHQYVGNVLNCSSCHLDRGRRTDSAPMWAAYVTYPRYRAKNHRVNTLEERIQGCFRFSMNGRPPPADSQDMVALVSYFQWLATGLPVGITPKGAGYPELPTPHEPPSIGRGAAVYATDCAMCHGADGEGRSARGAQVFPPLWGPRSFNWGAGMERISTAADFIKANMPYGAGETLTGQQAWDVAAFVVSHPRPQDPRFTGSVATTRAKYHRTDSYYGRVVLGKLLGAPANSGK